MIFLIHRFLSTYMKALTRQGRFVACAFNLSSLLFGGFLAKPDGKKARSLIHQSNLQDLAVIGSLLEQRKIRPVIARTYPLAEVSEAMAYLDQGQHYGKIVITVQEA